MPELQRPEIRELVETPFRIVYLVSDRVYVVAVLHAAQSLKLRSFAGCSMSLLFRLDSEA